MASQLSIKIFDLKITIISILNRHFNGRNGNTKPFDDSRRDD